MLFATFLSRFMSGGLLSGLLLGLSLPLVSQIKLTPRYLLSQQHSQEQLAEMLLPSGQWHPYPRWENRTAWQGFSPELVAKQIARGETALAYEWPSLTASLTLEYTRNGLRTPYQEVSFARRLMLSDLILAELIEGKGRFLDQIVDGIWLICEESYWGIPAHLYFQQDSSGLPDVAEPTVDLFAAETAALLAWAYELLAEPLDEISPLIRQRIQSETQRRVLEVNLMREDFWWMGFERNDKGINNWTVWINSNWLVALLILEEDESRRNQAAHKILRSIDEFLNQYPEDGSCDEGPSYWQNAGASLFDCLEVLYEASEGKISIYQEPLIRNMARYIYLAHLGEDYYANFADAQARQQTSGDLVARFGERVRDSSMIEFGAYLAQESGQLKEALRERSLGRRLAEWFHRPLLTDYKSQQPLPRDVWLPDNELMVARQQAGSSDGLCLIAKGFTNGQSHNHNDVGSFMIYWNGKPAFIDVGVGTYTRQTFSEDRYQIWTMQSAYHNLPTIGEVQQQNGWEFKAESVLYQPSEKQTKLTMELARAYPDTAGLNSWVRSLSFSRKKAEIQLTESYQLNKQVDSISLNLMVAGQVVQTEAGKFWIEVPHSDPSTPDWLEMTYDPQVFTVRIEKKQLDDPRMTSVWGESVRRIRLVSHRPPKQARWAFLIYPRPPISK